MPVDNFHGINFHYCSTNHEIYEIYILRKFPGIQYNSSKNHVCGKLVGCLTYYKQLLFDTMYVNNKLPHGMPSVVEFYYQLATQFTFSLSFPCPLIFCYNICTCHVEMLRGLSNITTQTCCPLMWPQKLNKLDDRKNSQF